MNNYQNCLRPEFTEKIMNYLISRKAINVFAEKGQGKSRLVDDIVACKPADTNIVRINLRLYYENFDGFTKNFYWQLKQENIEGDNINLKIFEALAIIKNPVFLIIENFDALFLPTADKNYNTDFVNNLNSLKERGNFSLLLTSCKMLSHKGLMLGGKLDNTSKINLAERIEMLNLSEKNIEQQILLACGDNANILSQKIEHLSLLRQHISNNKEPYEYIKFIMNRLNNYFDECIESSIPDFEKKLNSWQRKWQEHTRHNFDARLNKFGRFVKHLKFRTNFILGISHDTVDIATKWRKIAVRIFAVIIIIATIFGMFKNNILAWFN